MQLPGKGRSCRGIFGRSLENEASEERPKKKTTKKKTIKKARQSPGPRSNPTGTHQSPRNDDEVKVQRPPGRLPPEDAQVRTESPGGSQLLPTQSKESIPPRVSLSEGSLSNRPRIDFADRVEFLYNEKIPLVCNPGQCTELSRQIRGGPREMPLVGDLFFKEDYVEAALANRRSADQSGDNPVVAAPLCKERDPNVGDETGEKDDALAQEDRPKDADSAKFVEVPDSFSDEEEENVEVDESPSSLLVKTGEPSKEQEESDLAGKLPSTASIKQGK
ncbi:hypothetical protein Bca101_010167 [Brassica carinata]